MGLVGFQRSVVVAVAVAVGALGLVSADASALDITLEVKRTLPEFAAGKYQLGETFEALFHVDYDGQDPALLEAIFVSAEWDPTVYQLTSATSPELFILYDTTTGLLAKVSDPFQVAVDPPGTIRAVSYGAAFGSAGAGTAYGVTRLEFEFIGVGFGPPSIHVAGGDGVFAGGVNVTDSVNFRTIYTPEPSTALLLGLGLAGLSRRSMGRREPARARRSRSPA